jgi:hypothetical protein
MAGRIKGEIAIMRMFGIESVSGVDRDPHQDNAAGVLVTIVNNISGARNKIVLTPEEAIDLQHQITCALQNIGVLDVPGN